MNSRISKSIGFQRARLIPTVMLVLVAMASAQVQPNSAGASLTVNGRSGAGFGGVMPVLVGGADFVSYAISGAPNSPFIVAVGQPAEPGLPTGMGLANLNLRSRGLASSQTGSNLRVLRSGTRARQAHSVSAGRFSRFCPRERTSIFRREC